MSEVMFDGDLFRERLLSGIGDRSKASFARDVGISPQRLNTILSPQNNSVPTVQTIKRLAACMEQPDALTLLAEAAGYQPSDLFGEKSHIPDTEKERRKRLLDDDINELAERDLVKGMNSMTKQSYKDMQELIEDFNMLFAVTEYYFEVGERIFLENDILSDIGAYIVPITASWTTYKTENIIPFGFVCVDTGRGDIMVLKVIYDGGLLRNYGALSEDILDMFKDDNLENYDIIHIIKDSRPAPKEQMYNLYKFLNNENGRYIQTISGLGFKIGKADDDKNITPLISDDTLRTFINDHMGVLDNTPKSDYEKDLIRLFIAEEKPSDEVAKVTDPHGIFNGVYTLITKIMSEELGEEVMCMGIGKGDKDMLSSDNVPVILIPEDEIGEDLTRNSVLTAMNKYAKELGLTRYGNQYFTTTYTRDDTDQYEVR